MAIPDGWGASIPVGSWGNGLSEVARARQWIKIPAQAAAVPTLNQPAVLMPADDPQGRYSVSGIHAALFLSSPAGAEHGYGVGLPTTVRTVAFGAIPVEVGLRLEQLRDADNLPVPLRLSLPSTIYQAPGKELRPGVFSRRRWDSRITGAIRVRLTALSVDGVDVGLRTCVSSPIEIDLQGTPWWKDDPLTDGTLQPFPQGSTAQINWLAERGIGTNSGGGISGKLDIPAFSGCHIKTGEDLGPLLTAAVSGPGNAVTIGYAALVADGLPPSAMCGTFVRGTNIKGPRGPFLGDPSDCDPDFGPPMLDYPDRAD